MKQQINKIITNYCKEHNIKKSQYKLQPLYIHLNGFSHSIGFGNANNYNTVGYSNYMSSSEKNCWGYINEHQRNIATLIFANIPHYMYQNNAKEILF